MKQRALGVVLLAMAFTAAFGVAWFVALVASPYQTVQCPVYLPLATKGG